MAEMVEHQATVETGLKMKIKRKNPTQKASSSELRCKTASEDKNGNIKSRKAKQDSREPVAAVCDVVPAQAEETVAAEDTIPKEPEERPPKRKQRNTKSINRQTKIQNGSDYEVTKGNKSKPVSDNLSRVQVSSPRDKPKNGKICHPEKTNRKRAASVCAVVPVVSSYETPKAKSLRINTYEKDGAAEEKTTESRKTGYSGIKTDAEDSPRKAEAKIQQPHEILSQSALNLPDPYEFVAKVEDVIQTPIKKFKSDKADMTCAPTEPLLCGGGGVAGGGVGGAGDHHDMATETCSVGVTTDPDCLGPCEPGTSVILEGIVWSESNNGILVVNVTWRGKTYVGTLMDTTKHHWASPRFREDSPVAELDWRSPKSKRVAGTTPIVEVLEGRRLRKCRRNIPAAIGCTSSSTGSKGTASNSTLRQSPVPMEGNISRRRGRGTDNAELISLSSCAMTQPSKKARPNTNESDDLMLECSLLNCNKKFRHISGLNYHQSHAHRKPVSVEESKPGAGKFLPPAVDDNLEAQPPIPNLSEVTTHAENDGGVDSSSVDDLSADVVVPGEKEDLVDLQSVCSTDDPVCSDVIQPASISIASSCASGVDTSASGPGLDGKHPLKTKENHVSSPPPPPPRTLKSIAQEPSSSSESEQSSVCMTDLSRPSPASTRQVPQDAKLKEVGIGSQVSDSDKNHLVERKISDSPAPLHSSPKLTNSCQKSSSDDKDGKSCVISSTVDHQPQSETPIASSLLTVVSSSASSGFFPIGSDNKSPNYSDISDSAELLVQANHGSNGPQQGKDGDVKRQQRPVLEQTTSEIKQSRQQKSKHETTGGPAQQLLVSNTLGPSTVHSSAPPMLNGQSRSDSVRQQRTKESKPPSAAKESVDGSFGSSSNYTKPQTPEEKSTINRTVYHNADAEADAQAKEHRMWLENLHHHHHQNSAIANSMAMASSAAAAAMNMMPYGYGLDQAAYHLQFLSQNPETRSHYERWLMEQSHYLQQQQHHHHHQQQQQQQRCFSKLMQAEAERGVPSSSDSKPVDMTSKGSNPHPQSDSAPNMAPSFVGKPKTGTKPDGKAADGSKGLLLHKSTLDGSEWMSPVKQRDSLPSSNGGITDSCGDPRKMTTQSSGRGNSTFKEKLDPSVRPDQLHRGGKDALWDRNERTVVNKSSVVVGQETRSPDLSAGHPTPPSISKASNPVGNISPYSSGNPSSGLLKNFIQDANHPSLIGYSSGGAGAASFMDLAEANSISPNSKFLDLDSKQVVTGSNLRRPNDGRHALDVLRYQSAMYGKQPTATEHLGSNGPKHNRSTKDFLEEPGHTKDGKGSPSGHSSPLTLRHLHTHHHTHVVGAAYPMYGSYNGLMSPVPAIVPSGPPVISPTYLPK